VAGFAAFAPAAHATFDLSPCDTVQCFATWCANNAVDCVDTNPHWVYCDDRGCLGANGDITRYVAYCVYINVPTECLK
jgi:hypothetical protein